MSCSQNIQFFYQIVIAFCMLIMMSIGLVIVSVVLFLSEPNTKKRPVINIKEF
jgi:hypothetical protein